MQAERYACRNGGGTELRKGHYRGLVIQEGSRVG